MKGSMQASQLRQSSADDLQQELLKLASSYFKLRIQKATDQLSQTHLLKQTRRDIARIKTVLREKSGN